ncbi:lipoprotein insertase outer membrane protein LolB [Colwellia ponticola]|uniref:lipoprotein insertase outer membrane protein LolB n=1 Tax=Colwellia ponticola TaxID=2304625 RepID=UPI001FE37E28|nr:lipoprotein insertase outer membrane protein LolB [Colwellia ponticola]
MNIRFYLPYLLSVTLLSLFLSGCSTQPNKNENQSFSTLTGLTPAQRIAKLKQLQHWGITGKIAFIEKASRNSATLHWQVDERATTQQLNLTTYLGINILQLKSTATDHSIQVDGKTYHGNNLQALIYSLTGFTLPTKALTFWLKGIPFQVTDKISNDKSTKLPRNLSSLYNGELWQINYADYQYINGYHLASKFSIKKDDLLIKISVNRWLINE